MPLAAPPPPPASAVLPRPAADVRACDAAQTPDGVKVPEVLQPFMGGIDFLPFMQGPPADPNAKNNAKGKGGGKQKKKR